MIKIVHHSKTIGYSGTDKVAQIFCKYLKEHPDVDPYIVYRDGDTDDRLDIMREVLGDDHVIPYKYVGQKNPRPPYFPKEETLTEVLAKIDPDIFHIHRSGYQEWPGTKIVVPNHTKIVETNIFGYSDLTNAIDANIYISDYIRESALRSGNPDGPMIYNPTEKRVFRSNLSTDEAKPIARKELIDFIHSEYGIEIPNDAILMGRVGRPDNFDAISLKALKEVSKMNDNVYYLVVNGCDSWKKAVEELALDNVIFFDPIIDDTELSRFYLALDIYAHARHDGECCPCNIQEAMMHGIPVISHVSQMYNGQEEIVGSTGFVVPLADWQSYSYHLDQLVNDPELRKQLSVFALRRAMRHFEASCVTSGLKKVYDFLMEDNK